MYTADDIVTCKHHYEKDYQEIMGFFKVWTVKDINSSILMYRIIKALKLSLWIGVYRILLDSWGRGRSNGRQQKET